MESDKVLDRILNNLSGEFKLLAKKLSKPKFVLDISPDSLKKMGVENVSKTHKELLALGDKDYDSTRYIVFNSRRDLYAALTKVGARGKENASALSVDFSEVTAESDAIISDVAKKSRSLFQYASPDMQLKIVKKISNKVFDVSTKVIAEVGDSTKYDKKFQRVIDNTISKSVNKLIDKEYILISFKDVLLAAANGKAKLAANISKTKSKKGKGKVGKVHRMAPIQDAKGLFTSATNLQFLINSLLETSVEHNMGKSHDPAVKLRYQTGRFAKSAEVTSIRQENKNVYISYTYQRNPYDTFLPGGRLNPPLARDPRPIIGAAIRDIAIKHIHRNFIIHTRLEGDNEF